MTTSTSQLCLHRKGTEYHL